MKIIFKTSLLIIFLFISFTTINAATITWLGGNGAWEDPSEWDTGIVPTYGDDVIIPSGYCRIYNGDHETATSVEVQSSGRLYIYDGGSLEIQGAVDNDALHNMGRVYLLGDLAINGITQTSSSNSAKAIKNDYRFYMYNSAQLNIKYIDDVAIENSAANSYFRVRGSLWIYSVKNTAIFNQDRFYNYGTIDIEDSGPSSGFIIGNTDDFRNQSSGVINLNSTIYGGISNSVSAANFSNYGDIYIDNVEIGINNHGNLTNDSGALIECRYNSVSHWNRANATITNDGQMKAYYSDSGIYNYGTLNNYNAFWVFYGIGNGAIRNFSTGVIENYHDIYLNSSSYTDLDNDGDITNHNGGIIEFNKTLNMSSGSSIANYGFFVSHGSNPHIMNGSFGNKGVIDDNEGLLQGLFPNDRVIVAPISGPMQVGVPYPNVLDVASLSGLDIGDWKISQNGAIAGTYDENTNVFTPNASAAGISTIYISIEDLASGFSRNFSLEIDSPILPLQSKKSLASTRNDLIGEGGVSRAVEVFPNPSHGTIQLESDAFELHQTDVQIFNIMGQMVQQERFSDGSKSQSLDFSYQLTNGLYFVKLIQNGQELNVKRVQLNR